MKPIFQLVFLVSGPTGRDADRPWFIMETRITSDGPRTRICNGRWKNQEVAQVVLEEKIANSNNQ